MSLRGSHDNLFTAILQPPPWPSVSSPLCVRLSLRESAIPSQVLISVKKVVYRGGGGL